MAPASTSPLEIYENRVFFKPPVDDDGKRSHALRNTSSWLKPMIDIQVIKQKKNKIIFKRKDRIWVCDDLLYTSQITEHLIFEAWNLSIEVES